MAARTRWVRGYALAAAWPRQFGRLDLGDWAGAPFGMRLAELTAATARSAAPTPIPRRARASGTEAPAKPRAETSAPAKRECRSAAAGVPTARPTRETTRIGLPAEPPCRRACRRWFGGAGGRGATNRTGGAQRRRCQIDAIVARNECGTRTTDRCAANRHGSARRRRRQLHAIGARSEYGARRANRCAGGPSSVAPMGRAARATGESHRAGKVRLDTPVRGAEARAGDCAVRARIRCIGGGEATVGGKRRSPKRGLRRRTQYRARTEGHSVRITVRDANTGAGVTYPASHTPRGAYSGWCRRDRSDWRGATVRLPGAEARQRQVIPRFA